MYKRDIQIEFLRGKDQLESLLEFEGKNNGKVIDDPDFGVASFFPYKNSWDKEDFVKHIVNDGIITVAHYKDLLLGYVASTKDKFLKTIRIDKIVGGFSDYETVIQVLVEERENILKNQIDMFDRLNIVASEDDDTLIKWCASNGFKGRVADNNIVFTKEYKDAEKTS